MIGIRMVPPKFMWHKIDATNGKTEIAEAIAPAIELPVLWQRGSPPRSPSEELRVVLMRSVKTTKELLLAEVTRPEKPAEHSNFTNKII